MGYTAPSILFFITVIVIAHFFAPPGYDLTKNTISDLGSQGHTYKWIMQVGFIGFGLLLTGGLIWKFRTLGLIDYSNLPIIVYALSILVTGVFCAAPIINSSTYSVREAEIHSIFATIAGVALVTSILWHLITAPAGDRSFHLIFLLLVTGISMLFGLSENETIPIGKGIVQRVLYLTAFIWLIKL